VIALLYINCSLYQRKNFENQTVFGKQECDVSFVLTHNLVMVMEAVVLVVVSVVVNSSSSCSILYLKFCSGNGEA